MGMDVDWALKALRGRWRRFVLVARMQPATTFSWKLIHTYIICMLSGSAKELLEYPHTDTFHC